MGNLNILVIDEDPQVPFIFQDFLAGKSHNITSLNSPATALTTLKKEQFHIAVVSIDGSNEEGLSLVSTIRSFDDDIAIVVLATSPTLESATNAIALDVSHYLKKPFKKHEIQTAIERIAKKKGLILNPEENLHASIGQNIRRARKTKGLTLKQLSRRTDLSVSLLSQIERAESSASVSSLFKVSNALDLKLTSIFRNY